MDDCRRLKKAIEFHGHLGPYLVLGLLMGELAVDNLKCRRHFGIEARIKGALTRPKSCLIDGIQLSSGCTYGKGNIHKSGGRRIEVLFRDLESRKGIKFHLKRGLIEKLDNLSGRRESELFAKNLLKIDTEKLFEIKIITHSRN